MNYTQAVIIRPEPSLQRPASPGRRLLKEDPLYQCADTLMASRGIPLQDHLLLRENLASCLAQMEPSVLSDREKLAQAIGQDSRWGYKLHRELEKPYTDQEVFARLQDLEAGCKLLAESSYPIGKWFLSGSIPKARFGANSDVDLTCDAGFRPGQIEALSQQPGWEASPFRAEFQSGDPQLLFGSAHRGQDVSAVLVSGPLLERKLSEYDAASPLEVRQIQAEHGFLADIYIQGLRQKGYEVSQESGNVHLAAPEFSPERTQEMSWRRPGE